MMIVKQYLSGEISMEKFPTKKRPRVTKKGTFIPNKKELEQLANYLANLALEKEIRIMSGAVELIIIFDYDKKKIRFCIAEYEEQKYGKADLDNLVGAFMEAMQMSGLINNDRQVVFLIAEKRRTK